MTLGERIMALRLAAGLYAGMKEVKQLIAVCVRREIFRVDHSGSQLPTVSEAGVKRYTDEQIVLQGCGTDEYIYRRRDRRTEQFTPAE